MASIFRRIYMHLLIPRLSWYVGSLNLDTVGAVIFCLPRSLKVREIPEISKVVWHKGKMFSLIYFLINVKFISKTFTVASLLV
jgi:hypothetical protein